MVVEAGAGGGGGGLPPGPVTMPGSSFGWHGGVTAWRYAHDPGGNEPDEIVLLGRDVGKADFVDTHTAAIPTSRRTHFVDLAGMTEAQISTLIDQITNSGVTTLAIYTADDTASPSGSSFPDVRSYLATLAAVGTDDHLQRDRSGRLRVDHRGHGLSGRSAVSRSR